MRLIFILWVLFGLQGMVFAQIEKPNRSIKISPMKRPDAPPSPVSQDKSPAVIKYESPFEKKDEKWLKDFSLLPKKEEKSIMEPEPIRNPSEIFTQKMNKDLKKEGIADGLERRDYFHGEFRVFTPTIYISCRDNQAIDGDLIRIWINGEIVKPEISLESGFKRYNYALKPGENLIELEALNTGEFFPNTGEFLFQDGEEKPVTLQNWDLYAGHKAIVKIFRIDILKKQE